MEVRIPFLARVLGVARGLDGREGRGHGLAALAARGGCPRQPIRTMAHYYGRDTIDGLLHGVRSPPPKQIGAAAAQTGKLAV